MIKIWNFKRYNLGHYVLSAVLFFMVVSCKKDEEKRPTAPEELFGRWNMVSAAEYEVFNGEIDESTKDPYHRSEFRDIEFTRDWKLLSYPSGSRRNDKIVEFSISEDGQTLLVTDEDEQSIVDIVKLNKTQLVIMESEGLEAEEGIIFEATFEKQ